MDEKEFVVKITADASGVADTLDNVDKKLSDTDQKANELSSNLGNASGVGEKLAGVASQMASSLDYASKVSGYMEKAFAGARVAVEPLGESLAANLSGVEGRFSGFASELDDVQQKLISSQVSLEGLGDKLRDALANVDADTPRARVNEMIMLDKTVEKLNGAYGRQSERIIDIKLALQDAQKQLESLQASQGSIVAATQKDLTMTEARLQEYKDRVQDTIASGFNPSAGLTRAIDTLERKAQALRDSISGDHMKLPGYAEYASQIEAAEATISRLQGDLARETAVMAETDRHTGRYAARIEALTAAQTQASDNGNKLSTTLASIGARMSQAASVAVSLGRTLINIGKVGIGNIAGTAGKITGIFKAWAKPLQNVGNAIHGIARRFGNFFRMMSSRLRRMAITAIFKDIGKNSGQIAQLSEDYNKAISSMVVSAKALGAQIVAIAEPIISVAGPAISRFIDLLTAGADKLAQFTARLAGRDTYIQASKGVYDYASAVKESEESSKKAAKANNQFKASVMDFDELHKLEDNSKNTDDASAITGVTDSQLAKAKIQTSAISELADKIRKAISGGNFWGLGEILADEVVKAFSWLQGVAGWMANGKKFTEFLHNVIDTINGFFGGLNAGKVGGAIGDVANTIVEGFDILVHGLNADVIGAKIGAIFSGFAQTFDWQTAGRNVIAALQFVMDMVSGFLQSDALEQIGKGIADFFAGMVAEFDPDKVGTVIGNAINGIAQFLANSFTPETFQEAGQKVAAAINTIFETIDPEQVSEGINALVGAITGFINSLLSNLDISSIASTLGEIGSKLDWKGIFEIIAIAALPALIPAAVGLVGKGIAAIGGAILAGIPALGALAGAAIPVLIAGLATAAVAALVLNWDKVTEWAKEKIEWMKNWAKEIGEKVKEGFGKAKDWVIDKATAARDWVADKATAAKDWAVDKIHGIGEGVAHIGEKVSDAVSGISDWFGDKVNGIKAFFIGDAEASQADMNETTINNTSLLTPTSLACADAETVLARMEASFAGAIQIATNSILEALNRSGDITLYVDSERLARATIRGLNMADIRQNTASMAFA